MSADAQWPIQIAIYDALRADATLKTLIGFSSPTEVPVYDHVPQGTEPPYIVIGDGTMQAFDTKTDNGAETTVTIHTWTRPSRTGTGSKGYKDAKQVMAAIVDAIDRIALPIAGHDLCAILFEFSEVFRDEDGITRHGVQRFRAKTTAS
jgi:hypothetical protein